MITKKYNLFIEARLSDVLKVKGESDIAKQILMAKDEEFDIKQKLPSEIELNNNSLLKVRWNDTACHDLVSRLKDRSSFASIDHFIEYLSERLCDIFPYKLGKELMKTGRYSIYLKEYNLSIIIFFDLNRNMGKNYFTTVVTILPGRKTHNVISVLDI